MNSRVVDKLHGKEIMGRYQLLQVIGKGSFGTVYKGLDEQSKEFVAIKVIKCEIFKLNSQIESLVLNEIKALRALNHPNIIKYYGDTRTENNIYIILELCDDDDLDQRLRQRDFTEQEALDYFKQIIAAYTEMHKKGILHRDIKLENIMFKDNMIKLVDFGFTKIHDPSKLQNMMDSTILGTPIFSAPEILLSQNRIGIVAEVYSLGVLLYFMLFKHFPFTVNYFGDQNELDYMLAQKIKEGNLKFSGAQISKDMEDLLTNMLKYNPEERIDFAQLLKHQFFQTQDLITTRSHNQLNIFLKVHESLNFYMTPLPEEQLDDIMEQSDVISTNSTENTNTNLVNQSHIRLAEKKVELRKQASKSLEILYDQDFNKIIECCKAYWENQVINLQELNTTQRYRYMYLLINLIIQKITQFHQCLQNDLNIYNFPLEIFTILKELPQYQNLKYQVQVVQEHLITASIYQLKDLRQLLNLNEEFIPQNRQIQFVEPFIKFVLETVYQIIKLIEKLKKKELDYPETQQKKLFELFIYVIHSIDIDIKFPTPASFGDIEDFNIEPISFLDRQTNIYLIFTLSNWKQEIISLAKRLMTNLIDQQKFQKTLGQNDQLLDMEKNFKKKLQSLLSRLDEIQK